MAYNPLTARREGAQRPTQIENIPTPQGWVLRGYIKGGAIVPTKAGDKTRPKELPYFRIVNTWNEPFPGAKERYGDQPTEIAIMFPVEDFSHDERINADTALSPDQRADATFRAHIRPIFAQALRAWATGGLIKCEGNGKTGMRLQDDGRTRTERPCPCEWLERDDERPSRCALDARIVFITDIMEAGGGVFSYQTHSWANMETILRCLRMVFDTCQRISKIPLKLIRVPVRRRAPDGRMTQHYGVQIVTTAASFHRAAQLMEEDREPVPVLIELPTDKPLLGLPVGITDEDTRTPAQADKATPVCETPVLTPPAPVTPPPPATAPTQPPQAPQKLRFGELAAKAAAIRTIREGLCGIWPGDTQANKDQRAEAFSALFPNRGWTDLPKQPLSNLENAAEVLKRLTVRIQDVGETASLPDLIGDIYADVMLGPELPAPTDTPPMTEPPKADAPPATTPTPAAPPKTRRQASLLDGASPAAQVAALHAEYANLMVTRGQEKNTLSMNQLGQAAGFDATRSIEAQAPEVLAEALKILKEKWLPQARTRGG